MIAAVALMAVLVSPSLAPAAVPTGLSGCLAHATTDAERLSCYATQAGHTGRPGDPAGPSSGPTDESVYESVWLVACGSVGPDAPDATQQDCAAAHNCDDPSLLLMTLWLRQVRGPDGAIVHRPWVVDHYECHDPTEVGVVQRQLTWVDVIAAVRRVDVPSGEVTGPKYTLVNLSTTFYTVPHVEDTTLQIIGYSVDVHLQPVRYTWHWGDGSTETTDRPGRPYPATDVTHTYVHATDPGADLSLSVDVTYQARYRVDGGQWLSIPDPITVPGPSAGLPVRQASAVLVPPT
jgi:hypothetical protein